MSAKKWLWTAGLVLAGVGIVLARVVPRLFDQAVLQLAMFAVGVLMALAGLGFIMYGIKK